MGAGNRTGGSGMIRRSPTSFWTNMAFAALVSLTGAGCSAKKPVGVNLIVAPNCLTRPIELADCAGADSERCRTAKLYWKKGCEQIAVKK